MNKNGESIILIYHDNNTANKHNELWHKTTISSPWLDSRDIDELINGLKVSQRYYDGAFYVTQYIITPDVKYILKHPLATLRKITQKTTHARLDEFLDGINLDKTNIIIMDFVNSDITRKIIDLNKKKI